MENKENFQEHQQQPQVIQEKSCKSGIATVIKKYNKGRFLGKGGFAKCFEVSNIENQKVSAIKIISKETLKKSKAKQKLVTEIKIHKSLEHKNVIGFDHVFEDSENVYILLQLCNNHTLNEMMKKRKRISELQTQYFIYHIIQGLIYIHSTKVIHRDLKLGNLMLSENMEVKIGDFGLAAKLQFHGEKRKTICGTPNYLAPEIVSNSGHSYEVDIWSLGVILYALLYGRPPFQTSDVKKTYKRIKEAQYTFNDEINVSQNAKNLISRILVVEPSKRLTLQQILAHPFMNSNKIPKELPASMLSTPLPRSFIEQYIYCSSSASMNKHTSNTSMKNFIKSDDEFERAKSQKGISQRILLRSSNAIAKNLISKNLQKQECAANHTPHSLSNNFFQKPDSAKSRNQARFNFTNSGTVYVKKWVDYSSKYGLGYLLADGTTGIYFNDSTKMVLDAFGQKINYISNDTENGKKLEYFCLGVKIENKEINKKITLMQYFKKYLNGSSTDTFERKEDQVPTYVKKWVKSDQAILFRLSNNIIQVNFNDKSQIILDSESETMMYSNPHQKKKQIFEINACEIKKDEEICFRMEHVKALIKKIMISKHEKEVEHQSLDESNQLEMIKNY